MQEHDFREVGEPENYASIPAGVYRVRVADVRVGQTREGAERWGMRLEVSGGEYAGRTAAWDGLIWTDKGLPRVKFVLSRMGFETEGRLALEADDLVGRELQATLVDEVRVDEISGRRVMRLRVPYLGYAEAENGAEAPF